MVMRDTGPLWIMLRVPEAWGPNLVVNLTPFLCESSSPEALKLAMFSEGWKVSIWGSEG